MTVIDDITNHESREDKNQYSYSKDKSLVNSFSRGFFIGVEYESRIVS